MIDQSKELNAQSDLLNNSNGSNDQFDLLANEIYDNVKLYAQKQSLSSSDE